MWSGRGHGGAPTGLGRGTTSSMPVVHHTAIREGAALDTLRELMPRSVATAALHAAKSEALTSFVAQRLPHAAIREGGTSSSQRCPLELQEVPAIHSEAACTDSDKLFTRLWVREREGFATRDVLPEARLRYEVVKDAHSARQRI